MSARHAIFSPTFGRRDCVTNQKRVSLGGYHVQLYRLYGQYVCTFIPLYRPRGERLNSKLVWKKLIRGQLQGMRKLNGRKKFPPEAITLSEHRGKTYAHASSSAFPVCPCCSVVQINFVVRLAVFKLIVVNQQPQMKEERTTNTKKVCTKCSAYIHLFDKQVLKVCNCTAVVDLLLLSLDKENRNFQYNRHNTKNSVQ